MDLHVLHDAATVARLAGADAPLCERLGLSVEDPSRVLVAFVGGNPLGPGWLVDLELPSERIGSWSGTLAHEAVADGDLFAAHPHNWMQPGPEALEAHLDEVLPQFERAGRRLCLFPHARHVLSDVQGAINLIRARRDSPLEIALCPTSILTPGMLGSLEEHLERSFGTLAEHAPFLYLHDVVVEEDERLRPVPLGEGVLDRDLVLAAIDRFWPADRPVLLTGGSPEAQKAWLAG